MWEVIGPVPGTGRPAPGLHEIVPPELLSLFDVPQREISAETTTVTSGDPVWVKGGEISTAGKNLHSGRFTAGTCPHGGLVQIIFLSTWVMAVGSSRSSSRVYFFQWVFNQVVNPMGSIHVWV